MTFQFIIYIFVVLFGLSVGSFLNVVIARFDELKTIVKTRSHCPHCKKILPWYDLIPFFSYFLLAGKCRECGKVISYQYPLVEAAAALIFALIYWKFGISIESLFLILIASLLIIIASYDIIHSEIPDILTYSAIALAIGLAIYNLWQIGDLGRPAGWLPLLDGLLIGFGFFALLVIVSREKWMGWGDAILGAFMGIFLGYPNVIVALFLAFILGALSSLVLMALGRKKLKDTVPFGPFLVAATFIAFFWGEKIINLYLLKFSI